MVSSVSAQPAAALVRPDLFGRAGGPGPGAGAAASVPDGGSLAARRVEAPDRSGFRASATEGAASKGAKPGAASDPEKLSPEQEKEVQRLKQRDQEVRAHEAAHATVGGPYASAPKFEFTTGPDGKRYVTGGEVQIDASPVRDNPEATIRKMEVVIRAALAPAEPSSQDMAVARQAQAQLAQARNEARAPDGAEGARAETARAAASAGSAQGERGAVAAQAGAAYAEAAGIAETLFRQPEVSLFA